MNFFAKVAAVCMLMVATICSPIAEHTSRQLGNRSKEVIEVNSSNHTFLTHRNKVVCSIPKVVRRRHLVNMLNTTQLKETSFLGLLQEPTNLTTPADQPALGDCPSATDPRWPGKTDNLRSTCPWVYKTKYLGESFYPRYILDAECLCQNCISSNSLSCIKLRTDVTVYKIGASWRGLAVMTATKKRVTSGCFCVGNSVRKLAAAPPTE